MMKLTTRQSITNPLIQLANRVGIVDAYSMIKGYYSSQITILMYHRVGPQNERWQPPPVPPKDFEDQMQYLKKTHALLSLTDVACALRDHRPLPKKVAVVTFDDGYKSNYDYAFPILKQYRIPATIFLATGHIDTGTLFWWDKIRYALWHTYHHRLIVDELGVVTLRSLNEKRQKTIGIIEAVKKFPEHKKNSIIDHLITTADITIPPTLGHQVIVSWDDVREMQNHGIEFGAHTVTHPILTKVSLEQANYEITQSKKDIENALGTPVTTFSYPNGKQADFNTEILHMVQTSGYTCAVTTLPTTNASPDTLYILGRLIPWNYTSFKLFISGLYSDAKTILQRIGVS
jgi:peptidoglycan/xylan/chitin deacetylase (PgdA/CDA1 family)